MPSRPPTLYCDEDVSVVLAAMLRARGFPSLHYRVGAFSIALMLSATIATS